LKAYYACRDQLRELINENNINLWAALITLM
jgi:hypothetical protein